MYYLIRVHLEIDISAAKTGFESIVKIIVNLLVARQFIFLLHG